MSRVGRKPIVIPKEVKVVLKDDVISVEGPKGLLNYKIPSGIFIELKDSELLVKRYRDDRLSRGLHGLVRTLIFNMIKGVTEGYTKELEIVGMGFRAELKNNELILYVGFSHPVNFPVPEGIKIEVPKPTHIRITGIDKQKVGEVAARIRQIYPPEPYKGKGIRYLGEIVRKKIGKAAATTGK
ncbi:MAG: 50S ribosomal protein L6 [Candidatus Omnitrophica bacterium]|nr:50S ribosomal protein L6 [Candidatus Omnitrophota bacterium]